MMILSYRNDRIHTKNKKDERGTEIENIALLRNMLLEIKKRHEYITNILEQIKKQCNSSLAGLGINLLFSFPFSFCQLSLFTHIQPA